MRWNARNHSRVCIIKGSPVVIIKGSSVVHYQGELSCRAQVENLAAARLCLCQLNPTRFFYAAACISAIIILYGTGMFASNCTYQCCPPPCTPLLLGSRSLGSCAGFSVVTIVVFVIACSHSEQFGQRFSQENVTPIACRHGDCN